MSPSRMTGMLTALVKEETKPEAKTKCGNEVVENDELSVFKA